MIAYNIGTFINKFVKSFGTTFFWIRRKIANFILEIVAQIDEEEYCRARNTPAYRKIAPSKLKIVEIK